MSLVLVGNELLAIDGIPVDIGTPSALSPPVIEITAIDRANPSSVIVVTINVTDVDPAADAIVLHFFVRGSSRATASAVVASANGSVEVTLPVGFVLAGETLWCRATSAADSELSNPGEAVSLLFDPPDTGNALPANLPFSL